MAEQKNAPAVATAQGTHEVTITEEYTPTLESLQAKIIEKLSCITDLDALNRIYDFIYLIFLKAGASHE